MKRILCLSALALALFGATPPEAHAQFLSIGLGGVEYNGYGQGYYGGYGPQYRTYGPGAHVFGLRIQNKLE